MAGQYGWYTFWHAVWGQQYDDHLITYTGTVPPVASIPAYENWHGALPASYIDVPEELQKPLPWYDSIEQQKGYEGHTHQHDAYSIGHMGSYKTGGEGDGSHPGVDIRVPTGTPIVSIANGIVTTVETDSGYGKHIVIRHPHAPDPNDPSQETVLYSVYAHLSEFSVAEGATVSKGQKIGLSGMTGFATGPHLHFQIDRDSAPWHPYWPFSASEAQKHDLTFSQAINSGLYQERGFTHTIHPMLYVQANYPAVSEAVPQVAVNIEPTLEEPKLTVVEHILARREERRLKRLSHQRVVEKQLTAQVGVTDTVVTGLQEKAPATTMPVSGIIMQHDGKFIPNTWEKLTLTLIDMQGNTVEHPELDTEIQLRPGYGKMTIEPTVLSTLDFTAGVKTVKVLPLEEKTMVIHVLPYNILSTPLLRE